MMFLEFRQAIRACMSKHSGRRGDSVVTMYPEEVALDQDGVGPRVGAFRTTR